MAFLKKSAKDENNGNLSHLAVRIFLFPLWNKKDLENHFILFY